MASPQTENGYMKIATGKRENDIILALASSKLTSVEMSVMLVVLRKTWGFHKKSDAIPLSQFERLTGRDRKTITRAIASLEAKRPLVRIKTGSGITEYAINKDFSSWQLGAPTPLGVGAKPPLGGVGAKSPAARGETALQLGAKAPHSKETLSKETISKENTHLEAKKPEVSKLEQKVADVMDYFAERMELFDFDGSYEENERFAGMCVQKFHGAENVKKLIDCAANDQFWKAKTTSFKVLWNNGVKIAKGAMGNQIAIIS